MNKNSFYPVWVSQFLFCPVAGLLIICILAGMGLFSPGMAPTNSAQAASAPVERTLYLDSMLSLNKDVRDKTSGANLDLFNNPSTDQWMALPNQGLVSPGSVNAFALNGSDLYVGGSFIQTWDNTVKHLTDIARFNPASGVWSALSNNGLAGKVYALASVGSDLYVGGYFSQTADGAVKNLNNIAKYNTTTNTWSALPNNGLFGAVNALAVVGNNLYVGGYFTKTSDGAVSNLKYIARLNTTNNTWSALPNNGLNLDVDSLAVVGSDLYLGGFFTKTADSNIPLNHIAKFSTASSAWSALPQNGVNGGVSAIALMDSDVYLGGGFTQTGDGAILLNGIARFNTTGNAWAALPNNGLFYGTVYALTVTGHDLYVGGSFWKTGDGAVTNLNNIARFNAISNTWTALPNQGLSTYFVNALVAIGTDLYVGGNFTQTADGAIPLNGIARFNASGNTWAELPDHGLAYPGVVNALTIAGTDVYVAGSFRQTGDGALNLNRIARFSPGSNTWSPLPNNGLNGDVYALAVSGSDLYVGGTFTQTGDGLVKDLNHIARFSIVSNTWTALPAKGLDDTVYAMALSGNTLNLLYVGGRFIQNGDSAGNLGGMARFDLTGNTWLDTSGFGFAFPATVYAVVPFQNDFFAGGRFNQTWNGWVKNMNNIARFVFSQSSIVGLPGNGLNGEIDGLAVSGNNIYVGGNFWATGDGAVTGLNNIARFSTASNTWASLPHKGLNSTVRAFAVSGSDIIAGGDFVQTSDGAVTNLNRLARLNTTSNTWWALPNNGVNGMVRAIAASASDVYVAGSFSSTADSAVQDLNGIAKLAASSFFQPVSVYLPVVVK